MKLNKETSGLMIFPYYGIPLQAIKDKCPMFAARFEAWRSDNGGE